MSRYQALVSFDQGPGALFKVDVIEHLGGFWLVPEWIELLEQRLRRPVRIISLMTLQHQDSAGTGPLPRFLVNNPISKAVFSGHVRPEQAHGYIVMEMPDISLPLVEDSN